MSIQIFFHGTGARRKQSIKKNGLTARYDSFVYASTNPLMATVFAAARAEQEDDWGLLVAFTANKEDWEIDPSFPESFRRKKSVPPSEIILMEVLDPSSEIVATERLREFIKGIRIE